VSLTCLCSAHGSPGVTTTSVALVGVWPEGRRALLVEADPWGGMLAARLGLSDHPGLASLAAAGRHGLDEGLVWRHAQRAGDGVAVIVAPPSPEHARSALEDLAGRFAAWCGGQDSVDVVADCGRLTSDPVSLPFLRQADRVLIVVRPTVDQLRPAALRVEALDGLGVETSLLLVGNAPYGPEEVEASFGVPVAGSVVLDTQAAATLGGGRGREVRKSPLVRSAASLVDRLSLAQPVESAYAESADAEVDVEGVVR
jgi:MinD-like ATPase involved in chromosome partitioning or flagellar assembly